jgi:hypothetical protein
VPLWRVFCVLTDHQKQEIRRKRFNRAVDPSGAPNCPAGCIPNDSPETASCSRAWLADLTLVDVDRKDLLAGGGGSKKADPRSSRRALQLQKLITITITCVSSCARVFA